MTETQKKKPLWRDHPCFGQIAIIVVAAVCVGMVLYGVLRGDSTPETRLPEAVACQVDAYMEREGLADGYWERNGFYLRPDKAGVVIYGDGEATGTILTADLLEHAAECDMDDTAGG